MNLPLEEFHGRLQKAHNEERIKPCQHQTQLCLSPTDCIYEVKFWAMTAADYYENLVVLQVEC